MNAVVDFARSDLGAERLRVMIALFNRRAQRVCVLAGLVLDQTFLRQRDGVHFVVLMRDIEVRPQSNAWPGVTREGRQLP